MATSRGATPADPTLQATTEDNSRGGLFVRNNIANPVAGTDVSGTSINDTTVTLTITIDDDVQTGTFTLNNAQNQNVPITFTGVGGGGSIGIGDPVIEGEVDATGENIILERQGGTRITIPTGALVNGGELSTAIGSLQMQIDGLPDPITLFSALTDTPTLTELQGITSGQFLTADPTTGNIVLGTPRTTVDLNAFESSPTVTFRAGTSDSNDISADANIRIANDSLANAATATLSDANSIIVDPATQLRLTQAGPTGTYVLSAIAQAGEPESQAPTPSSAAGSTPPTPEQRRVMYTAPMGSTITNIDNVMVNRRVGNTDTPITIPPANIDTSAGTVTIPEADASPPGDYNIMADVTTQNDVSMATMTVTESDTIDRFIPYYQSRSPITQANYASATPSTEDWNGTITAIAGSGTLYVAALASANPSSNVFANNAGFPVRVVYGDTITVPFADGTMRTFNTFQLQASFDNEVTRFRATRRG